MKDEIIENENKKEFLNVGEWDRTKQHSTATENLFPETRVTGAIVFRGSVQLLNQLLFLIKEKGELIYHTVDSPKRKLYITDNDGQLVR